jgi:alkylation response protein AidB-like acyl-CoA dehydrogenase
MYRAPLKEIRFTLHHLIGDETLVGRPGLEDYSIDYADSVLDEAAQFAEKELAPLNVAGDREGPTWTPDGVRTMASFKAAYAKYVEAGWSTLAAPAGYGGQGAPTLLTTAVEELWTSANQSFKLCPLLTRGAVEAIHHSGSEALKALFLPRMVAGEWTGTMNLTESQAGSDLGLIRTRAVPDGAQYRIFGEKIFITYGDHDYTDNIVHLVLARIEGAPAGVRGISLFIVPKRLLDADGNPGERNDVRCSSIEHKLGIKGSPTCVMTYGSAGGAVGYLVGEPNRGLEYMFVMMNAARLGVALEGYAIAERAYQLAAEWARTRIQGRPAGTQGDGPAPISGHADVRRMLLTMRSSVAAARAVTMYAAQQLDLGRHEADPAARARAQARGELLIPIAKGWSTETGISLTSLGIQVHGGMGFVEETGAAQHYRDVRITTIYEGTTGIQALDLVGRKVGRDGGVAMRSLVADMRSELGALAGSPSAAVASQALECVELLDAATTTVLEAGQKGGQYVQAIAVPFLHLSGIAIGAWMMAKSHALASRVEAEDPEFAQAKRGDARFYLAHVAAQALGYARIVSGGADAVVDARVD